jgi:uncharacterized protein (DUF849 family)
MASNCDNGNTALRDRLIVNVAITGMVPMPDDTPHVPVTVRQIIDAARRCADAGAAIVHVHARGADAKPTADAHTHRRIIEGIRAACPQLIISGSTSGRLWQDLARRSVVLQHRPDMASLTLGSNNFATEPSINPPDVICRLAQAMREHGVLPECEAFEIGMIDYARDYLLRKGVIERPLYFNLLLGSLGTMAATPANLDAMVAALPAGTTWAAAGIGRYQLHANTMAIERGGHVRVGLEDNIWFDDVRSDLATNARLVERVVAIGRAHGRSPATGDEARLIIGLSPRAADAAIGSRRVTR